MNWIFNKMDYKWIGLEQKWIGSRKLDFFPTPHDIGDLGFKKPTGKKGIRFANKP